MNIIMNNCTIDLNYFMNNRKMSVKYHHITLKYIYMSRKTYEMKSLVKPLLLYLLLSLRCLTAFI